MFVQKQSWIHMREASGFPFRSALFADCGCRLRISGSSMIPRILNNPAWMTTPHSNWLVSHLAPRMAVCFPFSGRTPLLGHSCPCDNFCFWSSTYTTSMKPVLLNILLKTRNAPRMSILCRSKAIDLKKAIWGARRPISPKWG